MCHPSTNFYIFIELQQGHERAKMRLENKKEGHWIICTI